MTYHIFIIDSSGSVKHTTQPEPPELDQIQAAVGGYIEQVPYWHSFEHEGVTYTRGTAMANEEGRIRGLAPNVTATAAWTACCGHGAVLVGPVMFWAREPKNG